MLENIGLSEYILIAVAALILFGPDKMPEIGRKLGKAVRELRSVTAAFLAEVTRDPEQRRSAASESAAPTVTPAPASPTASEAAVPAVTMASESAAPSAHGVATSPIKAAAVKPHRSADPRRLPE